MEREYFTRIERKVFKAIDKNLIKKEYLLKRFTESQISAAVKSLTEKGFVDSIINHGVVFNAKLSFNGQAYKDEFRFLRNKLTDTNKWFIAIIISLITSIISIIINLSNK